MSWDADLKCACCDTALREWNYTHNTNRMVNDALGDDHPETWWARLHDLSGPDGAALLNRAIVGLEADPDRYRAMNPENGWGDYDSLVKVLTEMRDAVPEFPTRWWVWG